MSNLLALQVALAACSQLRHLVLGSRLHNPHNAQQSMDPVYYIDWALIRDLSEMLPTLVVLEFHLGEHDCMPAEPSPLAEQCRTLAQQPAPELRPTLHFDSHLTRRAARAEAAGLQLLQIEDGYDIEDEQRFYLPATLRYLSLSCW